MSRFTRRIELPLPADDVTAALERPGTSRRLTPPWYGRSDAAAGEDTHPGRNRLGTGTMRIEPDSEAGSGEVHMYGHFGTWRHQVEVQPHPVDARWSVLEDHVEYDVTGSGRGTGERELVRAFDYRHRVLDEDLRRHAAAGLLPKTIAITGSSGLIGRELTAFLTSAGHTVVRLVRGNDGHPGSELERTAQWRPMRAWIDEGALDGVDAVINLAGEPPYRKRWTRGQMALIHDSRVRSTRLLSDAISAMANPPRVLLSASGSSYYGDRGHEGLVEDSRPGKGFLADVCKAWERATASAEEAGVRVCHLRLGPVLSPAGGLLGDALPLLRLGLGPRLGNGRSWVPWITIDDVLYAMLHLLASDHLHGAFNLSAPHPVTQRRLVESITASLGRSAPLRVPPGLLSLVIGDEVSRALRASTRMLPQHLANSGFQFAYPDLPAAVQHLLGRTIPSSDPVTL